MKMSQTMKPKPAPVRPYNRFMAEKKPNMGVDPAANFARFILKEQSIDVHRTGRLGTIPRNESAD